MGISYQRNLCTRYHVTRYHGQKLNLCYLRDILFSTMHYASDWSHNPMGFWSNLVISDTNRSPTCYLDWIPVALKSHKIDTIHK